MLKTIVYFALVIALVFLVWQYVLPTVKPPELVSQASSPGSAKEAMVKGLKDSYGAWVVMEEGEYDFTEGEKYSRESLQVSSVFGDILFYCEQGLPCQGNPDQAFIRANFTASVTVYCPYQKDHCCVGIGYKPTKLADVC